MNKIISIIKSLFTVIIVFGLLASCASNTSRRDLETVSKQEGERVYCSGYKSWTYCYESIYKACSNRYVIISADENIFSQGRSLRFICKYTRFSS